MQRTFIVFLSWGLIVGCDNGGSGTDAGADADVPTDITDTADEGGGDVASSCAPGTDPDNDGISTVNEGGETIDSDGDTTPNYRDTDSDADTVPDSEEAGRGDCETPRDGDGDTTPDFLDDDSDNNGLADGVEPSGDLEG